MSLAFLTTSTAIGDAPPAESPFATVTAAAGATFEVRDGWRVATRFGSAGDEDDACAETVGWADVSYLGKLEVQAAPGAVDQLSSLAGGLRLGTAVRDRDAWWSLVTPGRALVVCEVGQIADLLDELEAAEGLHPLDISTQLLALRVGGPLARETMARFCALDLRAERIPVGAFLPGSVARTPGYVLCEGVDRFLVLAGSAYAEYLWTVVSDAGRRLGGRAVGVNAFDLPAPPFEGAGVHA